MALWMVRTGRYGERENFALEKGFVVIGWDEMPDLSNIKSFDEMKEFHLKIYPDEELRVRANFSGQLWAFVGRIQVGDLVALPLKTRSAIALGKITGDYQYRPEHGEGAKHVRAVKWIRQDIPRNDFRQDLRVTSG
jgi:restriction system protein